MRKLGLSLSRWQDILVFFELLGSNPKFYKIMKAEAQILQTIAVMRCVIMTNLTDINRASNKIKQMKITVIRSVPAFEMHCQLGWKFFKMKTFQYWKQIRRRACFLRNYLHFQKYKGYGWFFNGTWRNWQSRHIKIWMNRWDIFIFHFPINPFNEWNCGVW